MRKSRINRIIVTLSCLLIVGSLLLFFAACGGNSTPASPGGGQNTPQGNPPGYSLIDAFSH